MLTDNAVFVERGELVHPDDFASPAHAAIFAAMLDLDGPQRPVDHLTVAEELKVRGQLAAVGGPRLPDGPGPGVPLTNNAVQYAHIVQDQSLRRRLAGVGRGDPGRSPAQETGDVEVLLDEAERKVFHARREASARATCGRSRADGAAR